MPKPSAGRGRQDGATGNGARSLLLVSGSNIHAWAADCVTLAPRTVYWKISADHRPQARTDTEA